MSLSIAIDQIQRRTWWFDGMSAPRSRPVKPETIAMRDQIVIFLEARRAAGERRVLATEVQRKFDITNAKLWHLLAPLVTEGRVIKHKPRHDESWLEVK